MTIVVTITIQAIDPNDPAKGAGVSVIGGQSAELLPEVEVACLEGLAHAINAYMRKELPEFDMLRGAAQASNEVH